MVVNLFRVYFIRVYVVIVLSLFVRWEIVLFLFMDLIRKGFLYYVVI